MPHIRTVKTASGARASGPGCRSSWACASPDVPSVVAEWRDKHLDAEYTDGQIITQPWPAGPTDNRRDQVFYYHYKTDRARRTLRGIDEQLRKAANAVAGKCRSSATRSSSSPAPRRSTAIWKPRRGRWRACRVAPTHCRVGAPSEPDVPLSEHPVQASPRAAVDAGRNAGRVAVGSGLRERRFRQ